MPVSVIIGVRYTDGRTFVRNAGKHLDKVLPKFLREASVKFARAIETELRRSTPRRTGRLANAWTARPVVRGNEFGVYIENRVPAGRYALWQILNFATWSKHRGFVQRAVNTAALRVRL